MYWGNGMDGWGFVLMALTMVLFWGLLITPAERSGFGARGTPDRSTNRDKMPTVATLQRPMHSRSTCHVAAALVASGK